MSKHNQHQPQHRRTKSGPGSTPVPKSMETALEQAGAADPQLERTFRGHRGTVNSCSFSSTMRQLVSGGEDSCLMLWNFRPTLRAFRFVGHKSPVNYVEFSPSGNLIASASKDRTVRLWLPNAKGESTVLKGHMGAVRSATFSPNGRLLLTSSDDKTAKLWELAGRQFLCTLQGHSNWVRAARFAPDGRLAATGSDDKTVKLWEISRRQCLQTFFDHSGQVNSVAFSPDGTCLAAASADESLKMWDTRSYSLLQHYPAHSEPATSVQFHPSGMYLLSASEDTTLKIWDVREGRLLYTIHGHQGGVSCASWSPDGKFFASGGGDQLVMVWRTNLFSEGAPGGIFEDQGDPPRRTPLAKRSIPSTAPLSHYTDPNDSSIISPPRISRETYPNGTWERGVGNGPKPADSQQLRGHMFPPQPPQDSNNLSREEYILKEIAGGSLDEAAAAVSKEYLNQHQHDRLVHGGTRHDPHSNHGSYNIDQLEQALGASNISTIDQPPDLRAVPANSVPPTSAFSLPVDRDALPEVLAGTLDHIVGQLDLITRTLAVMEQRLTYTEDKIHMLSQTGVLIPNNEGPQNYMFQNGIESSYQQEDNDLITPFSDLKVPDETVSGLVANMDSAISHLLKRTPQLLNVVHYKIRPEKSGYLYRIKVKISEDEYIHVDIFQSNASPSAEIKLMEPNKYLTDPL